MALYQEEFAELLDLPWKTLQAIENGRRQAVRLDTLEKIASGYGIELWQLFHPDLPSPSVKRKKLIAEIMKRRNVIQR